MLIEYVNCSLAKKILTVSNGMRALLTSIKPSADIGIIGSGSAAGIDLQAFNRDLYKYSLFFEGLGISQEDFVTVFIGRPEIRKGFGLVIELWKNQFKNNSTKLLLCGPEDADVANILGDVPENIICLGFVENIAEILSLSDCLILPSLHEGLSYAVLEAMACKCLVIANNIPGMQYLITDGESGFLVDDNDAVGYAKILDLIRNNHFDINSIKEKGYISIQKFSRESFMKSYIKFLRKQGLDSN
jgi:glycosyltransferase involved in cell wall biosynthesis